jgi:hypothetical protein
MKNKPSHLTEYEWKKKMAEDSKKSQDIENYKRNQFLTHKHEFFEKFRQSKIDEIKNFKKMSSFVSLRAE